MTIILTPAYGRDYASRQAVLEAFDANLDFVIATFGHRYEGKPVNKEQILGETVSFRFAKLRKVFNVVVPLDLATKLAPPPKVKSEPKVSLAYPDENKETR